MSFFFLIFIDIQYFYSSTGKSHIVAGNGNNTFCALYPEAYADIWFIKLGEIEVQANPFTSAVAYVKNGPNCEPVSYIIVNVAPFLGLLVNESNIVEQIWYSSLCVSDESLLQLKQRIRQKPNTYLNINVVFKITLFNKCNYITNYEQWGISV